MGLAGFDCQDCGGPSACQWLLGQERVRIDYHDPTRTEDFIGPWCPQRGADPRLLEEMSLALEIEARGGPKGYYGVEPALAPRWFVDAYGEALGVRDRVRAEVDAVHAELLEQAR